MENDPFFHAWVGHTVLHPVGLVAIIVLGCALLLVPRRHALMPIIIMGCFVAPAQRVVVGGLNFDLLRLMVLFGVVRVLLRNESRGLRWTKLDSLFVAWAVIGQITYCILFASGDAIQFCLGQLYDSIGMYFLFRSLVRSWDDIRGGYAAFAVVSLPVSAAFVAEHFTGHNIFAIFGGVPELTHVRDGARRCQGAFAHPILAGCFWASVTPLIFSLCWSSKPWHRVLAAVGFGACGIIIVTCASSTPVLGLLCGAVAVAALPLRRHMRWIRWAGLLALVALHVSMNAPVWHLLADVDVLGGSTGWHRYWVINEAVKHFSDWWLVGIKTTTTWDQDLFDITNQYVLEGCKGGLIRMVLFIGVLAAAFAAIGRAWRANEANRERLFQTWCMGACLIVHAASFFSISYFGQIVMLFYLHLAMVGTMSAEQLQRSPIRRQVFNRRTVGRGRSVAFSDGKPVAPAALTESAGI